MKKVVITRSINNAHQEQARLEEMGFKIAETTFAFSTPVFVAVMPENWTVEDCGLYREDFYDPQGVLKFSAIEDAYSKHDCRIVFH